MRLFSPTTGCTYLTNVHSVIPSDALPIPEEIFLKVIADPAPGKVRSVDEQGMPVLVNQPKPSETEQAHDLYATQYLEINRACEAAITGGFTSSALGKPHQYSSQLDDQLNLTGVILAGLDTLYACRDEAGYKDFRAHSFEQIRQVGDDFTAFKLQLLQKANTLKQQLDQALASDDLAVLEAVSWEPAP